MQYINFQEMLSIAAMLVVPQCFVIQSGSPRKFEHCRKKLAATAGDHFTLLNIYNEFCRCE